MHASIGKHSVNVASPFDVHCLPGSCVISVPGMNSAAFGSAVRANTPCGVVSFPPLGVAG